MEHFHCPLSWSACKPGDIPFVNGLIIQIGNESDKVICVFWHYRFIEGRPSDGYGTPTTTVSLPCTAHTTATTTATTATTTTTTTTDATDATTHAEWSHRPATRHHRPVKVCLMICKIYQTGARNV